MKKDIICIVCPKGCNVTVEYDENGIITMEGYGCNRGIDYVKAEVLHPVRMITSSVKIEGAKYALCPVKTSKPVAKNKMKDIVKEISSVIIKAPVQMGDIIIENVCESGADIIATQTLEKQD